MVPSLLKSCCIECNNSKCRCAWFYSSSKTYLTGLKTWHCCEAQTALQKGQNGPWAPFAFVKGIKQADGQECFLSFCCTKGLTQISKNKGIYCSQGHQMEQEVQVLLKLIYHTAANMKCVFRLYQQIFLHVSHKDSSWQNCLRLQLIWVCSHCEGNRCFLCVHHVMSRTRSTLKHDEENTQKRVCCVHVITFSQMFSSTFELREICHFLSGSVSFCLPALSSNCVTSELF